MIKRQETPFAVIRHYRKLEREPPSISTMNKTSMQMKLEREGRSRIRSALYELAEEKSKTSQKRNAKSLLKIPGVFSTERSISNASERATK